MPSRKRRSSSHTEGNPAPAPAPDIDGDGDGDGTKEQEQQEKEPPQDHQKRRKKSKSKHPPPPIHTHHDDTATPSSSLQPNSINTPGKPAEAGIIQKVQVENFMCHRKLTIDLCRNVNFIHGQNGSGKSAILAAIQICLGAGAKRTHRARNLKELIRKEGDASNARVRVTLLNRGNDAFRPDQYGDSITVERCISKGGGYNGYKLLNQECKEISRTRKDLDAMLDQLNIQVENPVAVLDQEEAKKFLTGKAEDKYSFFTKATDLERIDRSYASVTDTIHEVNENKESVRKGLVPASETVKRLRAEWQEFQALEKLEQKVSDLRLNYGWSVYSECHTNLDMEQQTLALIQEKKIKREEDVKKAESTLVESEEQNDLQRKISELTAEAQEATQQKQQLEEELRHAHTPVKQHERALGQIKREMKNAKKGIEYSKRELQNVRNEIMKRAGSAQSEEAKRTAQMKDAEAETLEKKSVLEQAKVESDRASRNYEELEGREKGATENVERARRQLRAVEEKIKEMKSSEGSNTFAVYGPKCAEMYKRVEHAKRQGKFQGDVVGPIGIYLKIAAGKEEFASLAERALGGGMDRFVVTNNHDRSVLMGLRNQARCSSRDCSVIQISWKGQRYNVKQAPEGVETVESVLNIENDLIYNCLVDDKSIDSIALFNSKEESEEALLETSSDGRSRIRGGHIKSVFVYPKGDFWQVIRGETNITANTRPLKQTIGIDRSEAIRSSEMEAREMKDELANLRSIEGNVKEERKEYKIKWNHAQQTFRKVSQRLDTLEGIMEEIRNEAAAAENPENTDTTVTDLEDEVKQAEAEYARLKETEEENKAAIEELKPGIEAIRLRLDETNTRNGKVLGEITQYENALHIFLRSQSERSRAVEKRKVKLKQALEAHQKQLDVIKDRTKSKDDALHKARLVEYNIIKSRSSTGEDEEENGFKEEPNLSDESRMEEINRIEPKRTDKPPEYYMKRIDRSEREIERERQRRQLTESDPEVALQKYKRAKNDLDSKVLQLEGIKETLDSMIADVAVRKKRWKEFRSHISDMTNEVFDEMLNKKGSSGQIDFDHSNHRLNLIVQKDNKDEASQTDDVKALSGGERSFTTLSLLLALGESLETPFRVMDEFDVFLDPLARKIALETMIKVAKELCHRQFIFITPQDLSNLKTDPMLKIFRMTPPSRSNAVGGPIQQTLD